MNQNVSTRVPTIGKRLRLPVFVALGLGCLAALLRAVLLLRSFDAASGYYSDAGALPALMWMVVVLAFLGAFASFLFLQMLRVSGRVSHSDTSMTVSSGLLACLYIALAFEQLLSLGRVTVYRGLYVATAVFCLIAAFLVISFGVLGRRGTSYGKASLGLFMPLSLLCLCFEVYFDTVQVINCPNKPIFTLAAVMCAFCGVLVCRFYTEERRSSFFIAVSLFAIVVSLFASLPGIVWRLVRGEALLLSVFFDLLLLGYAIWLTVILLHTDGTIHPENLPSAKK